MNVAAAGQRGRSESEEEVEAPAREKNSGDAAGQRETHTFGEKLPNESEAARPEGGAN